MRYFFSVVTVLGVWSKSAVASVEDDLRARLVHAGDLLAFASMKPKTEQCSCRDYCTGQCFAYGCAPCAASTWSFPGGEELCLDPGPLGHGLLCQVVGGKVSDQACCTIGGNACSLPQDECCSSGGCSSCPKNPGFKSLFEPLSTRIFDNATNLCKEAQQVSSPATSVAYV
mmetsp:Transcript_43070/g.77309  ORF Transcript_43070/g.77309 Transcript_43070/m.77309 type:complete len:171 (+) Transcript_43070:1-513(+)